LRSVFSHSWIVQNDYRRSSICDGYPSLGIW